MPISTSCSCGRKLNLKDELAGKTVKCPQCGTPLKVPGGAATATAIATPPPRQSPAESRIIEKPKPDTKTVKKEQAGPKVVMANFKSLDDFDDSGNLKKTKKTFSAEDKESHEVGSTGGEMAKLAAEAMKVTEDKPKKRCPGCGRGVKPEDVICTRCGTNIKTGRRLGEPGFTISRRVVLLVLAVVFISGLGAVFHFTKKKPKKPEDIVKGIMEAQARELESVQKALEGLITDMEPSTDRMLPHTAYLGSDALPLLSKFVSTGTPLQRRKAVKLLEILAYHHYRSPESAKALAGLSRDPDPKIRETAMEALFWSAADPAQFPFYWAPGEIDMTKRTDTKKMYALPFNDSRELLDKLGIPMVRVESGPDKGQLGNKGRRAAEHEIIPAASEALKAFYEAETDPNLKLSALIQAVRSGRKMLMRKLISYLEPEPCKELVVTPPATSVNRAWRCLQDETGRSQRRFDDWVSWWDSTGKEKYK